MEYFHKITKRQRLFSENTSINHALIIWLLNSCTGGLYYEAQISSGCCI